MQRKMLMLIDGPNFHSTAKILGLDIDYRKLLQEFQSRGNLLRAIYYTPVHEDDEFVSIIPLVDWLAYNGYSVVSKSVKTFLDTEGRRRFKGTMSIELTVDALELASHVDQVLLCSGDGDFRALVQALQRRGIHVTVVSSVSSKPRMCADELRRQADAFVDMCDLQARICRTSVPSDTKSHRSPRRRIEPQAAIQS